MAEAGSRGAVMETKSSKIYLFFHNSDYTRLPLYLLRAVGCAPKAFSCSFGSAYTLFLILCGLWYVSQRFLIHFHDNDFSLHEVSVPRLKDTKNENNWLLSIQDLKPGFLLFSSSADKHSAGHCS